MDLYKSPIAKENRIYFALAGIWGMSEPKEKIESSCL